MLGLWWLSSFDCLIYFGSLGLSTLPGYLSNESYSYLIVGVSLILNFSVLFDIVLVFTWLSLGDCQSVYLNVDPLPARLVILFV